MYQYSTWIIIWSVLYYYKIVDEPPLYCTVIMCLMFSFYLLFTTMKIKYIIGSVICHLIPLFLIDYRKIKTTHRMININILVTLLYVIFMSYNDLYIVKYYSKLIDILSYSENINLYNILVEKYN